MRIACVHVPQLSLQCVTRVEPALRGAALAVAGAPAPGEGRPALTAPVVVAVSRAAWALGVRVGMTAVAARGINRDVRVVHADPNAERELSRALADALLTIAPTVDLGGRLGGGGAHLAIYAEVPGKLRGAAFGTRAQAVLAALGLAGRVGIADDRFTAWVAASEPGDSQIVSVPRGGAPAYLADKPLSLLAITPEVLRMLEALGVATLGEFAALPAPSVTRPVERDYQALARGEGGTSLRPYAPDAAIREELALGTGDTVASIARRVALRLAGRARLAARLEIASYADAGERVATVEAERPLASAEDIADAIAPALASAAWRVRVTVVGEALATDAGVLCPPVKLPPAADLASAVLATTGTADLFVGDGPAPTGAHGRYRRTRRGKHRPRIAASPQSRLFEDHRH
jgi:protein ImuB